MDKEQNTFKAANIMQQETLKAIQELTAATLNNRETMDNFAQANSALTQENKTLKERVTTLESIVPRMGTRLSKLEGKTSQQSTINEHRQKVLLVLQNTV